MTVDAVLGARSSSHLRPLLDGFTVRFHGECAGILSTTPAWWNSCRITAHLGAGARSVAESSATQPYTVTAQCSPGQRGGRAHERVGIRSLTVSAPSAPVERTAGARRGQPARIDTAPDPIRTSTLRSIGVPSRCAGHLGPEVLPFAGYSPRDATMDLVDDLGCNIVRCWGGNVYESDHFFNLCDEKGIMVWQDFAYACTVYPQTADFLARVQEEIEAVVKRLRNHPSLAIWCGDNEIDAGYVGVGLNPEHNRLTREVIPNVLQRLDPYRHFVPSSPYIPPSVGTKSDAYDSTPEQHLWGPRNYYKSPYYLEHSAHFIGEIGYHGCNNVESIKKFISPEHVWPWQDNPEWRYHDVSHHRGFDRDRIKLMANQVKEVFGSTRRHGVFRAGVADQPGRGEEVLHEYTRARKWATSG